MTELGLSLELVQVREKEPAMTAAQPTVTPKLADVAQVATGTQKERKNRHKKSGGQEAPRKTLEEPTMQTPPTETTAHTHPNHKSGEAPLETQSGPIDHVYTEMHKTNLQLAAIRQELLTQNDPRRRAVEVVAAGAIAGLTCGLFFTGVVALGNWLMGTSDKATELPAPPAV
jgi:hypothetical protein